MDIEFKNGSKIKILPDTSDVTRGKRACIDHWLFDYETCRKEIMDDVLKSFQLKWYQRLWLRIISKFRFRKREIYLSSKYWRN